jgi:hypothetical protein
LLLLLLKFHNGIYVTGSAPERAPVCGRGGGRGRGTVAACLERRGGASTPYTARRRCLPSSMLPALLLLLHDSVMGSSGPPPGGSPPHLVVVAGDDFGSYDGSSYRGGKIPTPDAETTLRIDPADQVKKKKQLRDAARDLEMRGVAAKVPSPPPPSPPLVACAMLTKTTGGSAVVFCAPGGLGHPCLGCGAAQMRSGSSRPVTCTDANSTRWWQRALDQASAAAAGDVRGAVNVELSPGIVKIASALNAWPPLGTTGVHVPSGVSFGGLCAAEPTEIVPLASAANASSRLWSLLLVAGPLTGHAPEWPVAATNATVRNLVLSGVAPDDVAEWRRCEPAAAARGQPPSAVDQSWMRVARGIFLPYTGKNVHVVNCRVLHTFGNAIETGVFAQWTPQYPADATDPTCHNGTRFCRGKVYGFRGEPHNPNTISNNTICDARFGGVTVIGSHVHVRNNYISVSEKTWVSPKQNHGTTMAVSAAFVGSSNVVVVGNTLYGGDYAVGSDGSFPLYTSVALFQSLWPLIYKAMSPAFRKEYSPAGPPLDAHGHLSFHAVQDFVDAQQKLLDLCVRSRVASTNPSIFDAGFGVNISVLNNFISGSVAGVSFYRQRASVIAGNRLVAGRGQLAMWGVVLDHSHNTTVSHNIANGWKVGVMVRGLPKTLSRLGGSFSCIGSWGSGPQSGNLIRNCQTGVQFLAAGYDNAVRGNTIVGFAHEACDYRGAQRLKLGVNWTTDNQPISCNRGYYKKSIKKTDAQGIRVGEAAPSPAPAGANVAGTMAPRTCQPLRAHPAMPIFHIIGNVTQINASDPTDIKLEVINDVSAVVEHLGIYHVFHQCCQNHWDHVISRDLVHWQRLPPPLINDPRDPRDWYDIGAFDGSLTLLPVAQGGPTILYDAVEGASPACKAALSTQCGAARATGNRTACASCIKAMNLTGKPGPAPGQMYGCDWHAGNAFCAPTKSPLPPLQGKAKARAGRHRTNYGDPPTMAVARAANASDPYLLLWVKDKQNPINFTSAGAFFPSSKCLFDLVQVS